jgi:hypothetical protein
MLFDILLVIVGAVVGWHFPQPLWVKVAWTALQAWIAKIRSK